MIFVQKLFQNLYNQRSVDSFRTEGISEPFALKRTVDSFCPEGISEPSKQRNFSQSFNQKHFQNLPCLIRKFPDFVYFFKTMVFNKFQDLAPCVKYIWIIYLMCFIKVGIYIMGITLLYQVFIWRLILFEESWNLFIIYCVDI